MCLNNCGCTCHAHITECIWPDCTLVPYDAATGILLCPGHFMPLGRMYVAERKRFTNRKPDPAVKARAQSEAEEHSVRRKAALDAQAQVYYVKIGDRIKIGYTNNVRSRMSALRVPTIAVLATEPGGRELERIRRQEFAGLRDGRLENFFPHDRLLRHIEHVRETFGPPKITTYPKVR